MCTSGVNAYEKRAKRVFDITKNITLRSSSAPPTFEVEAGEMAGDGTARVSVDPVDEDFRCKKTSVFFLNPQNCKGKEIYPQISQSNEVRSPLRDVSQKQEDNLMKFLKSNWC